MGVFIRWGEPPHYPDSEDPQKGTTNFGKPPYQGKPTLWLEPGEPPTKRFWGLRVFGRNLSGLRVPSLERNLVWGLGRNLSSGSLVCREDQKPEPWVDAQDASFVR